MSGNLGQWSRPPVDTGLEFTQDEAKSHTSGHVNEGSLAGSNRSGIWLEMEKAQKSALWTSTRRGRDQGGSGGASWEEVTDHLSKRGRVSSDAFPHSSGTQSPGVGGTHLARPDAPTRLGEVQALGLPFFTGRHPQQEG